MRSPGVIYRQYRKMYRNFLYKKYADSRKICHGNCVFGKTLECSDGSDNINLCFYGCVDGIKNSTPEHQLLNKDLDLRLIDNCSNPQSCSAFIYKYTKQNIAKAFEEELNDPIIKFKNYPELAILEWVLDKSLLEAKRNSGILSKAIVWVINLLENTLKFIGRDQNKLVPGSK